MKVVFVNKIIKFGSYEFVKKNNFVGYIVGIYIYIYISVLLQYFFPCVKILLSSTVQSHKIHPENFLKSQNRRNFTSANEFWMNFTDEYFAADLVAVYSAVTHFAAIFFRRTYKKSLNWKINWKIRKSWK